MRESKSDSRSVDRRNFLKLAGVGGGAAAVSIAAGSDEPVAAESVTDPTSARYIESAHVCTYYDSTHY